MIYILIYFAWHIVAFSSRGWLFKEANCSAGYRRSQTMNGSNQATHILAGCLWLWHYRCHYPKCAANCNLYSESRGNLNGFWLINSYSSVKPLSFYYIKTSLYSHWAYHKTTDYTIHTHTHTHIKLWDSDTFLAVSGRLRLWSFCIKTEYIHHSEGRIQAQKA